MTAICHRTAKIAICLCFRLLGSTADIERGQDRKTLKAITDNINGLESIKGETIWCEFKSVLMQPKRYECVKTFFECGGAIYLGKRTVVEVSVNFTLEQLSDQLKIGM